MMQFFNPIFDRLCPCRGWLAACSKVLSVLLSLGLLCFACPDIAAAANPMGQDPIEVKVSLGTADNTLQFVPSELSFEAGQRYKILLTNPSPQKHYFTAKDFADVSWTQQVQTPFVEVKGAIHEVELKPGGMAEWLLVPMKAGTYELHCSIPGHTEAGMKGAIAVTAS